MSWAFIAPEYLSALSGVSSECQVDLSGHSK